MISAQASVDVVCLVKALVDDEDLDLDDGRRLRRGSSTDDDSSLAIHADFRVVVLANRPVWPFQGNDFLTECGAVFSTHFVDHPDLESQTALAMVTAPSADPRILRAVAAAFADLRNLGGYPYSTRELTKIAHHLEKFDGELDEALDDVFSLDLDPKARDRARIILHRHLDNLPRLESMKKKSPKHEFLIQQSRNDDDIKQEDAPAADDGDSGTERVQSDGQHAKDFPPRKLDDVASSTMTRRSLGGDETGGSILAVVQDAEREDDAPTEVPEVRGKPEEMTVNEYEALRRDIAGDVPRVRAALTRSGGDRAWRKHQTHGDLDDGKLVDAVVGDSRIYKRRGYGGETRTPVKLVVDVSRTTYDQKDGRLQRILRTVALLCEAAANDLTVVGYSGTGPEIPMPGTGLTLLRRLASHAQYSRRGDATVAALQNAVAKSTNGIVIVVCGGLSPTVLDLLGDLLSRYPIPYLIVGDDDDGVKASNRLRGLVDIALDNTDLAPALTRLLLSGQH